MSAVCPIETNRSESGDGTLLALASSARDAIIVLDDRGAVVFWNDAAERMFGYRESEVWGREASAMLTPERCSATYAEEFRRSQPAADDLAIVRTVKLIGRRKSGEEFPIELSLSALRRGEAWHTLGVIRDLTRCPADHAAAHDSEQRLRAILDAVQAGVLLIDVQTRCIVDANPAASAMFEATREDLLGKACHDYVCPFQPGACPVCDCGRIMDRVETVLLTTGRREVPVLKTVVPITLSGRQYVLESFVDITERKQTEKTLARHQGMLEELVMERSEELLEAQRQVLQAEKLASVGRLAAGIAHEINTPIQYVGDNLHAICDFLRDLQVVVARYREGFDQAESAGLAPEVIAAVKAAEQEHDLEFILEDAPKAVEQALEGVQRVAQIVRAMKDFSHIKGGLSSGVDINSCLRSTLTVARNEYKYCADLQTDFGQLPIVACYPGELNQVFLNLLINAAHAIQETGRRGLITVSSRADGDWIEVAIADTGTGIPEHVRDKIWDPFFTTKEVGKGTGQGLFISRQIVEGKHHGTLAFETEIGKGTTFRLRIPTTQAQADEDQEGMSSDQDSNPVR